MNWLAHAALTPPGEPLLLVGNLLGDRIRGLPDPAWPTALQNGVRLHRALDSWVDAHPLVREAYLDPPWRRWSGVLLDLAWDHCLASRWDLYHPEQTLPAFVAGVEEVLQRYRTQIPNSAQQLAQSMVRYHILLSWTHPLGIRDSLVRLAAPGGPRGVLPQSWPILEPQLPHLSNTFAQLYPDLRDFTRQWLRDNSIL